MTTDKHLENLERELALRKGFQRIRKRGRPCWVASCYVFLIVRIISFIYNVGGLGI